MTLGVSVFVFSALIAWVSWKLFEFAKKRKKLIDFIDEIPGPRAFPLIGSAYQFKLNSVDFSFQIEEWGRTYAFMKNALGVIKAWVGPVPVVFLCKAEAAKILLESTTQITKPPQYNFLKRWLGTGLLTSTGGKWHARRKMLTPAFHFNILNKFVPIFSKESKVFADQIEKQADTGVEFDLFPYVKRCALDIICETAMGAEIGSQMGKNMDYVDAVTTLSRLIWHYERLPWMWLKPIWYLTGNGYTFDAALEMTTNFTRKIISERQENFVKIDTSKPDAEEFTGKRKLAFLDLLLNMQSETKLTDEDIREEVDTFMFEGHDTTSSGIGFTIWLLAQNPECQAKVHAEVDAVFGDSDRLPTHEDLKKLSYLEQCIKEALRLLPSVPFFARILTEDYHYREITIPSGVTVVVAPVAVHRDPTYWGDDAEAFNPDHFLPENIAKRHPYSYVPFAAGPRNCIGQKFAIMEEKSVCSAFFRRYRVTTEQNIVNDRPVPELILKPSDGFKVKMYKRSVAC